MAQNLVINSVTYNSVNSLSIPKSGGGNATFPDTSDATAVAADLLSGKTAYANGVKVTGNIPSKTAQTYTPTTSNQTISSGQYLSGAQTISGDADLVAANIADGVTIFGVTGTYAGGGTTVVEKDVNFYDFNGTFVAGYLLSELPLAELPTPPDHSGHAVPLTFQSWNYTLSQVNALTQKQDIGAVYVPTDGKTHIRYTITTVTGGNPTLTINNTGGGTLTVNWGDGSAAQTDSGTGNKAFTPVSAIANGSYDLTVSSTAAYAMPTLTYSTYIFGSAVYNQCITAAYLGDGVTSIGEGAFNTCYSLTSSTIPNGVTSIGDGAFSSCYSLTSSTIPNGVTSIGAYAFGSCSSLTSITIPDSVTSIGEGAFIGCYSLALIAIPDGVTSIGDGAFSDCSSLASITIPDSVTSIGMEAFYGCYSLASITIPNGVTSIGAYAFYGCYSLVEYDFSAFTSVPTLEDTNVFASTNAICIMKIPAALYDTWTTETNWDTYANYMVAV